MKKFLLSLAALAAISSANADESVISSIEFTKDSDLYKKVSNYTSTWTADNDKWTISGFNNNNCGWDFIACGRNNNNASTAYIATSVTYSEPITKIVFSIGDRLNADLLSNGTLYVADNAEFEDAEDYELTAPTEKNSDWTVTIPTPVANRYYKVYFDVAAGSSNGQALSVTKVALYSNSTKANPEYKFDQNTVTVGLGETFTEPTFTMAAGAPAPTYTSSNEEVATVDAATGKVTIVAAGTTTITAKTEGNDNFIPSNAAYTLNVIDYATFAKATTVATGKYVFALDGKVCTPIAKTYSYGYLYFESDVEVDGDDVKTNIDNAIEFEYANGKFTMKDCYGRYLGMDDSHFTSFQLYTEVNEGCYWTAEFVEGGAVKLTNALNTDCIVCKTTYANIAPTNKITAESVLGTDYFLPTLYGENQSGVESIVVDNENAEVEYFNIQGVRVANPANGLYIRRQGNKVEKVIVK